MLDDKTIESPEVDRIQDALLRAVSGLATAVAHEVNNPLTALKGHLELLLPHLPGHLAAEYVAPAMEAAESIERIVRAMNGIVRVEFAPDAVAPMPEMLDLLGCAGSRAA